MSFTEETIKKWEKDIAELEHHKEFLEHMISFLGKVTPSEIDIDYCFVIGYYTKLLHETISGIDEAKINLYRYKTCDDFPVINMTTEDYFHDLL
jgi:hypothetical protein